MTPEQEAKVDKIIEGLAGLVPQVAANKSDINYLRSASKRNEVDLGRHDVRIDNVADDVNKMGAKVRKTDKDFGAHASDTAKHRSPNESMTDATVRLRYILAAGAALMGASSAIGAFFSTVSKAMGIG